MGHCWTGSANLRRQGWPARGRCAAIPCRNGNGRGCGCTVRRRHVTGTFSLRSRRSNCEMSRHKNPPEPWKPFLDSVDGMLTGAVELHCFGGFVVTQMYGLARTTPLSPPACVRCWWCSAGRWNRAPHAHFRYSARWSASPLVSFADRPTRKRCWQARHRKALNRQRNPRKRSAGLGRLYQTSLLPHARHRIIESAWSVSGIKPQCSVIHPSSNRPDATTRLSPPDTCRTASRWACYPPATRQHQPGQHCGPLVGVPNPHAEDIGRGLLVSILRQAGIQREGMRSALILFPARSETDVPQPKRQIKRLLKSTAAIP